MSGSEVGAIRRRFDRSAAGSYDNHAHVQRMMAQRLAQSIVPEHSGAHRKGSPAILEIGCGTGALTARLASDWPSASIAAIDISAAMLASAVQRVEAAGVSRPERVRYVNADIEEWAVEAAEASFDLIVSNACFQWLREPGMTLLQLRRLLRPDGKLAFVTFGPDTFRELHLSFGQVYSAYGAEPERHGLIFLSADEWRSLLSAAGLNIIKEESMKHTELYLTPQQFLHSVKAMGASASNASGAGPGGIGKRRLFAEMYEAYAKSFGVPGGVKATYELFMFHAANHS